MRPLLPGKDAEKYSQRLSLFETQSFSCFLVTIFVAYLLRLSSIVWAVSSRCVEADQFWFEPYEHTWSLAGVFFLIVLLLLVWNTSIAIDHRLQNKRIALLIWVNFIAVLGLLAVFGPMLDSSQLRYNERNAVFGRWLVTNHRWSMYDYDQCLLARDYVGRWRVVSREIRGDGLAFPRQWIEFKQSLTVEAYDNARDGPIKGNWNPPDFSRNLLPKYRGAGRITLSDSWGSWIFDLQGGTLTLTTPEWAYRQPAAVIVLERVPIEED